MFTQINSNTTKNNQLKSFSEIRKARAEQILEKAKPEVLEDNTYLVPSQYSNKKYVVTHLDTYSCECEDFRKRCRGKGLFCKHIQAIILNNKIKNAVEVEENNIIYDITNKKICPYCKSENLIKRGLRKTKTKQVQRFGCKDCKKRFTLEPIKNIKVNPKMVCLCMDLYFKGNSLRDISDTLQQFYNIKISHETIRNWIKRFTKVLNEYSKTLTPNTSNIWNVDETLVLTKRGKEKNQPNKNYDYVWNVLDNKTKFLLASINSGRSRKTKDAQKVFAEAHKQTGKIPYQIIVDGYKGYQGACMKNFRNYGKERKVKFTSIKGKRKEVNNNIIENHHTHQKEFQKVRRGIKDVQAYQDGFKIFHNFIRKGVKDKLTPAERCDLVIQDNNRWLGMLNKNVQKVEKVPTLTQEIKCEVSPTD